LTRRDVDTDPTRRNRNQSKKMLTQLQLSKLKPHQRGYERIDKKNLGASSDSRLLSKTALDSLLSKDKRKFQDSGKFKHDQYLDTEDDYSEAEPEDDDEDDEEEDEGPEEVGSIHPFGPNVDAGKLLHSLIHSRGPDKDRATADNDENDADVMHFSNSPYPAVTRKYPHLDGAGAQPVVLPGQPRDLQAQIVKSRFITLSWLEPAKSPEEVTSYSVFYKSVTSDRERKITTKSRDDQEVNIQALMPGKEYQFRVVANSASGPGESSEILEISTQPEENISGPPQNVDGEAVSASEIHVKWDPPVVTNGIISKYRVYYSEGENGHEMYADSTDTSIRLTELRPYREYTISVASWNQNGMGVSSGEILLKTHSAAPSGQPNNVTLETTSSTVSYKLF
jgi:neogenin